MQSENFLLRLNHNNDEGNSVERRGRKATGSSFVREEMEADHLAGAQRHRAHLGDREGGRVGADDRVAGRYR